MEVLVMRHGQSVADTEGRCEGNADFALTDLGLQQATSAATWIAAHFPPQMIFSSPLKRAAQTAQILGRTLDVSVTCDDSLREMSIGIWAGLKKEEAFHRFPIPAAGFRPHERVPDGESGIEVRTRAEEFWSRLTSTHGECPRVAVISHGTLITMLFRAFLSLPTDSEVGIQTGDTGIHLWRMAGRGRSIGFLNRCEHLIPGRA
jgi:2,3-bisphosphoglycerate-dependent phosphoglycerate mutase